jgi:hypothetical protein
MNIHIILSHKKMSSQDLCRDCKDFCRLSCIAEYVNYDGVTSGKDIVIVDGDVITFDAPQVMSCKKCKFEFLPRLIHEQGRGFTIISPMSIKIDSIHAKCGVMDRLFRCSFFIATVPNFGTVIRTKKRRSNDLVRLVWLDDRSAMCAKNGFCEVGEINGIPTGCFYDKDNNLYVINSFGNVLKFTFIHFKTLNSDSSSIFKIDEHAELLITAGFESAHYISNRPQTKTKAAIRDVEVLPNN